MKTQNETQFIEPSISRKKFDREIKKFKKIEQTYRKKGIMLFEHEFPKVILAFAVPKLRPTPPIAFAVKLDFTNYDLEPPSITFIDPFSGDVLKRGQIPVKFLQISQPEQFIPNIPAQQQITSQDLLQGNSDTIPFFCIPGVKEYHDHPYHSGDSWFLYRNKGEGELITLVDQLYNYSMPYIQGYQVNLTPQVAGFQIGAKIDIKN